MGLGDVGLDGQRIFVGGSWFRYDAASTEQTDGGIVFIPDSLTAAANPYLLEYGHYGGPDSYRQLPHAGLVWGSVSIDYDNQTKTVGSKWLHGHSRDPRHGPTGATRDNPLIDHKLGRVWGDLNGRIRNLIWTNINTNATPSLRTANLTYRYATGPGRWVRETGSYVTPDMFGGKPNDSTFDNSFAICWALNWLNSQTRVKTLRYEGNYYVKGFWGEVFSNIKQIGQGRESPCVTYQAGVIDFLKTDYLGGNSVMQAAGIVNPYRLLWLHHTLQVQFDEATGYGFEEFLVDGNIANNLYFLTDTSGAWDVTPISGAVSASLRESPNYAGFFITNHGGRRYGQGSRFFVDDACWMNMGGSCFAYAGGGEMVGRGLKLRNSLSGRVLYGGQGDVTGIELGGYTRTSFASPYSGRWRGVVIKDVAANPWPANALDPAGIAFRGTTIEYTTGAPNADERYGERLMAIAGGTINLSGVACPAVFKWSGEREVIRDFRIVGPDSGCSLILKEDALDNVANDISGPCLHTVEFVNRHANGVHILTDIFGAIQHGVISDLHIRETFVDGVAITKRTLPALPFSHGLKLKMSPQGSRIIPQQVIDLKNVTDETYKGFLAYLAGGDDADAVPTLIRMNGCSWRVQNNVWFRTDRTTGTMGTQLAPRLRIEMVDCVVDTFDPNTLFVGGDTDFRASMERVSMTRCRTHGGRQSEIDTVASVTVDAAIAAAGYVDFDAGLMWSPLTYSANPVSMDACAVGVKQVSPHIVGGNYAAPKLRVYVNQVSVGQVLSYRLQAAVAP